MEQSSGKDILRTSSSKRSPNTLDVGYGRTEDVEQVSRMVGSLKEVRAMTPGTPQKAVRPTAHTPLTPMANLKVLVAAAAASSAIDREHSLTIRAKGSSDQSVKRVLCVDSEGVDCESSGAGDDDITGRKTKSLAVLCKKFLSIAESEVGVGTEFSLETMASSLGTNRRRIYDIINVLESLEMIMKQSKNWYMWLGRDCLLVTLAKLKAMARDDLEFRHLYDFKSTKENKLSPSIAPAPVKQLANEGIVPVSVVEGVSYEEGAQCGGGSRWDKSLGVLCQKFVMLFLVTPNHEVTLDCAGNILMPDTYDSSSRLVMQAPTNPKTKVRRLYDIANVLTTLGLIRKKTFLAPNHRKMPGYCWCGPSQEEIDAIPVSRKNEFPLYSIYPVNPAGSIAIPNPLSGARLSRKPSFGKNRPFLHQYEVKGQQGMTTPTQHNSAPNTPVKSKEAGFKRSLSFGGGVNPKQSRVAGSGVRGVAPSISGLSVRSGGSEPVGKHLFLKDYVNEIHEFEAEMLRHAHKYPHVIPLFHEFIQKYKSTLELSAANGRSILPKPPTFTQQWDVNFVNKPSPSPVTPLLMEPSMSRGPFLGNSTSVPPLAMESTIAGSCPLSSCPVFETTQSMVDLTTLPSVMSFSQPSSLLTMGSGVRVRSNGVTSKVSAMNTVLNVQTQATYVGEMLQKVNAESAVKPFNAESGVKPFKGKRSINGQLLETQTSSPAVNLTCTEALPTEGYSKLQCFSDADTTAHNSSSNVPQNKPDISYQHASTKLNLNPTTTDRLGPVHTSGPPVDLTTAILSSLVNQQPIPAPVESTSKSAPTKYLLPKANGQTSPLVPGPVCDLKGLSPSAILAGQIVTCLQPNTDASQLINQIPTTLLPMSQLSSIFSLPSISPGTVSSKTVPCQSGSVRVPLGVVQGRVPVSLSGKNHLKEDSGKENEISPPKRPRLA